MDREIMKNIIIYHDGKPSRGYRAKAIKSYSKRILVEFYDFDDELQTVWFYRRSKNGIYEARGWNYWILPIKKY